MERVSASSPPTLQQPLNTTSPPIASIRLRSSGREAVWSTVSCTGRPLSSQQRIARESPTLPTTRLCLDKHGGFGLGYRLIEDGVLDPILIPVREERRHRGRGAAAVTRPGQLQGDTKHTHDRRRRS